MGSILEVVQTVKHPQSHIRSASPDTTGRPEGFEKFNLDFVLPKSAATEKSSTPMRKTIQFDNRSDALSGSFKEADKKSGKSKRNSLVG